MLEKLNSLDPIMLVALVGIGLLAMTLGWLLKHISSVNMRNSLESSMAQAEHQAENLSKQLEYTQNQLDAKRQDEQQLLTQLATEKEARKQEFASHQEKITLLQESRDQLSQEFERLSQKIFAQKSKEFSEQNKEGMISLLTPFREQLDGLKKKVEEVYVADAKDRAGLKQQIIDLQQQNLQMTQEAHALSQALRGEKKTQGNWGEMVLETVLEKSGLREGHEYRREDNLTTSEGKRYRPDVVIQLPDNKHLVVDSKVSLNAYTDYVSAESDAQKAMYAKAHVEAIRKHIRDLSDKAYQTLEGIHSPDFVFLFMPIEPAFVLAFQEDEALFNEAFERRIVVVTPTTLLATLKTVANIWAMENRNRHTEKLADQAGKVYDKLATVVERLERLGKNLTTAQNTYDETWKALKDGRGNLVNQVAHFQQFGIKVKKELAKELTEEALAEHESGMLLDQAVAQEPVNMQPQSDIETSGNTLNDGSNQ